MSKSLFQVPQFAVIKILWLVVNRHEMKSWSFGGEMSKELLTSCKQS